MSATQENGPRASLTERRKATTQLELAETAARLFAEQGYAATSVEQVATEAGVALRTFYRYFPTKAHAVAPLLSRGARTWQLDLAALPYDGNLVTSIGEVIEASLTPQSAVDTEAFDRIRRLLAAVAEDRDLQRIWYTVNGESEQKLRQIFIDTIAADESTPLLPALLASAATDSIKIALEVWAEVDPNGPDQPTPAALARDCYRRLTAGLRQND